MHTVEDGATAPIEVPAFVDTYVGSRRHVPTRSGAAAGYTMHHWEIRGHLFLTVGTGTDVYAPCARCGGEGHYMYNSLDGTVCYGCWGDGLGKQLKDWNDALRIVKGRESRQRTAARKAFAQAWDDAHAWNVWRDGRAGLIAALIAQPRDEYTGDYAKGFIGEMASKVASCYPLTEKQEAAVLRTLGQRAERIEAKQAAGHWGIEGKRGETEVTIRSARDFEGDYGVRYLVIMDTPDGQTLKTWASGEFGWTAARLLNEANGAPVTVTIKATVKKDGGHTEYQGTPQTEVQRVTIIEKG
jgi:hypothetical protein